MVAPKIRPGLRGQKQTFVCEHNVAPHVPKFSTPSMIQLMEQASMVALEGCLEEGQTSVGIEVNIRHLAPADIGATVVAHAEILEVDRNRLVFQVEAFEGERKLGEGTHRRAVIDLP
ncbi:MAG: hypothetical protein BZY81_01275 [SAR202 cluster bacterium Io17-Chloro-G4]|nr:MAG: hypothetical protein BZY81_01275 [SAR202 cluster bacterium Io17-Chloro-G4]